jgi:bifunctional non-homologous end joining protein LigD
MRDQLSLQLEPELAHLPNLPDGLRPMRPRPADEPFDSEAHVFEPWWGGLRALAYVGPSEAPGSGDVRIVDEAGRDVGAALPELAGMAVRLEARSAVLDGELVATDDDGLADNAALERRIAGEPGRAVAFLAFDLLHLDGRSLLTMPLHRRRELLKRILHAGDELVAVPAIAAEGRALHAAAAAQGIAGILARQRTSPYLPGVTSRLWRFVPAAAAGATKRAVTTATSMPAASADDAAPADPAAADATAAATPVIALIRRLPLLFED